MGNTAGVEISHADRVYWREEALTKGDLADYYREIAPVLLAHLRDRPFTIKQHYTVPRGPFRWIKDAPPELPEWIPVSPQPAKSRGGELVRYPLVNDVESLSWMVDFGVVDLHVWPSRVDAPDRLTSCSSTSIPRASTSATSPGQRCSVATRSRQWASARTR